MSETERIRSQLQRFNHSVWGFVIYRCTYGDDARWTRFMSILHDRTRTSLEVHHSEDLLASLDWSVQEDPSLNGASINEVRRRFRAWVAESGVPPDLTPRYGFCIHVDAAALESVLSGPQPPQRDRHNVTYVNLVDRQWEPVDPATFDWEGTGLDPATDDPTDEGEEDFEGSRRFDLGWMRLNAGKILPRTYNIMGGSGWSTNYRRPPAVASL